MKIDKYYPLFLVKTIFSVLFICFISGQNVFSQTEQKFTSFYYDKVSMFEILPVGSDEIVFLGDSITERCEWNELFSNSKIIQRGISGDITEGVLNRLSEITKRKPQKLFLMIGVNDLRRNISADSIVINYKSILNSIKSESPSTKIIIQSVLPVNNNVKEAKTTSAKVKELNQKLEKLANALNLEFVNLFPSFVNANGDLNEELTSDGLHINGKGYLIWKNIIEQMNLIKK